MDEKGGFWGVLHVYSMKFRNRCSFCCIVVSEVSQTIREPYRGLVVAA